MNCKLTKIHAAKHFCGAVSVEVSRPLLLDGPELKKLGPVPEDFHLQEASHVSRIPPNSAVQSIAQGSMTANHRAASASPQESECGTVSSRDFLEISTASPRNQVTQHGVLNQSLYITDPNLCMVPVY